MLSCVLPCICRAFCPIAIVLSVCRSSATMDGSLTTILSLWMIMVLAVPRSIASSCERNEKSPIFLCDFIILMFEMAGATKDECEFVIHTIINRFVITD